VLIATTRAKMEDTFYMFNVDGFLSKPFQNDVFLAKIRELLDGGPPPAVAPAPAAEAPAPPAPEEPAPAAPAEPAPAAPAPAPAAAPPAAAPATGKALVAGADAQTVSDLAGRLKSGGVDTDSTSNGPEVLSKAVVFGPDVILMDVEMTGMAGADIIRALRALPQCAETRIVLYSCPGRDPSETDRLKKACLIAGASEYAGPYEGEDFLADLLGGPEAGAAGGGRRLADVKVFVAGANGSAVEDIVGRLGGEGAETDSTTSGPEVLAKAVVFSPELILMDLEMSVMASADIIRALRALSQCADTRILMYSCAGGDLSTLDRLKKDCLDAGATDYLGPCDSNDFMDRVTSR
jgi:CheY-like chemotaxis protein